MKTLRTILRWLTLAGLALAVVGSIGAAFLGASRSGELAASRPAAVLAIAVALLLLVGLIAWRSMLRSPGLAMSHLGAVLVLAGGLWGSPQGQTLRNRLAGTDEPLEGYVPIPLAHLDQWPIQSIGQFDDSGFLRPAGELDFTLQPHQARIEYYPPASPAWRMEAAVYDDAGQPGQTKILTGRPGESTSFEPIDLTVRVISASANPPAITLELTRRDMQVTGTVTHERGPYERLRLAAVFASDAEWLAAGRPDILLARPRGPIKDYLLDLEALDGDGNGLARQWVEVNHPLHAGGYHIYINKYNTADGYILLYLRRSAGLWMVWSGFAVGLAGLMLRLWVEPAGRARRREANP